MSDRLILLFTDLDGREPCVHIYRGDFEGVLESFKNCNATTTGDSARMTLLDISYGEEPIVEMWVKELPYHIMRIKKNGYRLKEEVPEKKEVKKKLFKRVKKWLLKLIQ